MEQVVLLLGSNLDNRFELLEKACDFLSSELGKIEVVSSIYETAPWGFESENSFLNQAIKISTYKNPKEVLEQCLSIEKKMGRTRKNGKEYQDRCIDIDILLFGDLIISEKDLEIPHPRMQERRFCMAPLNEIAATWRVPSFNKTVKELLENCSDNSKIEIVSA